MRRILLIVLACGSTACQPGSSGDSGCQSDRDCASPRICDNRACAYPASGTSSSSDTPTVGSSHSAASGHASSGSSGGTGGSNGNAADYEAWCPGYRNSYCTLAVRCGNRTSIPACLASLDAQRPCNASPGLRDGRMAFDANAAAACLTALNAGGPCAEVDFTSCDSVLVGTGTLNSACYDIEDCSNSLYCDETNTCPGVCRPRVPAGSGVQAGVPCAPGTAPYDSVCALPVPEGQSCAPTGVETRNRTCQDGFFCSASRTCVARKGADQPCTSTFGECAGFLYCHNGTCGWLGLEGSQCGLEACQFDLSCVDGRCGAYAGLNQPCSPTLARCLSNLVCDTPAGMTQGTCKLPQVGTPCSTGFCGGNLYCSIPSSGGPGVCAARQPTGSPCAGPLECTSLVCTNGTCAGCVDPTP